MSGRRVMYGRAERETHAVMMAAKQKKDAEQAQVAQAAAATMLAGDSAPISQRAERAMQAEDGEQGGFAPMPKSARRGKPSSIRPPASARRGGGFRK